MYLRTVWFEDRNRVGDKRMRFPCAAEKALGWVLGPKVGLFCDFNKIKSPSLDEPPYLLKRGGWTIWSNPKAYLA